MAVDIAREHKEWEVEYMTMEAKIQEERDEAYAEGCAEGRAEGHAEGCVETLYSLVADKVISLADAARRADMTEEQFISAAKKFV